MAKQTIEIKVDERELATVLAALRDFQKQFGLHPLEAKSMYPDHFTDDHGNGIDPLDEAEIDELCERLNFGGE